MPLFYHLYGGPFEGRHTLPLALGEWLVLFVDEQQSVTDADSAFALVAYRQEEVGGGLGYRFAYCLTPQLQKFQIEYADGPFQGIEASSLPMLWLPEQITLPLDQQARALRDGQAAAGSRAYLAHYQRQTGDEVTRYFLTKITRTG